LRGKKCALEESRHQIYSQCLDSSNFNHWRTTFPLIASYFFAHLCVMNLLVPTLKKKKNTYTKEKMEINPALVGNTTPYWLLMGHRLVMAGCLHLTLRTDWTIIYNFLIITNSKFDEKLIKISTIFIIYLL